MYLQHPLSALFPAMSSDEFASLKDSIENIGVKNAITIHEGMVLDGWNRYRAATELGMPCPTQEFDAVDDPRDFVLAQNGRARRHLLAAQLIALASKVYAWKGVGSNQAKDQPQPETDAKKGITELSSEARISSRDLAGKVGVTQRSIEQFREVERKAVPEVLDAVEQGEIGLPKAAAIAKLPVEQQADAIKAPMPKPTRRLGKPKKVAAVKLINAEIKAAEATKERSAAEERAADLEREIAALREQLTEARDDLASVAKVLDAGDALAAALADAKEARDLARGYKDRINSMTTQIADLKRSVAHWEKKARASA